MIAGTSFQIGFNGRKALNNATDNDGSCAQYEVEIKIPASDMNKCAGDQEMIYNRTNPYRAPLREKTVDVGRAPRCILPPHRTTGDGVTHPARRV